MSVPEGYDLYVTDDGVLEPLGVFVLRDSRQDLLPRVKEQTEIVPGKHGEVYFKSKLLPRLLELHVVLSEEISPTQREAKKREIAKHLDSSKGVKKLGFADQPNKIYFVKYAGSIDLTQYPGWFRFVIPFKCNDPYAYSVINNEEEEATDSPHGFNLEVEGNISTDSIAIITNEGGNVINGFVIRREVAED